MHVLRIYIVVIVIAYSMPNLLKQSCYFLLLLTEFASTISLALSVSSVVTIASQFGDLEKQVSRCVSLFIMLCIPQYIAE